jgi:uncharacterized protein (DUF342 family)
MSQPPDPALSVAKINLCFTSKTLFHEKEGVMEQVETTELVRRGQVVATFVRHDAPSLPGSGPGETLSPARPVILLPGRYTELSAAGDSLLATMAGYPQILKNHADNQETLTISLMPLVEVSADQMEAALTLYPPLPGVTPPGVEGLIELLQQEGIRYGLNREILRDCLDLSAVEQKMMSGILIAMGLRPIPGVDAYLRFEIEIGAIPGKILGDGRIDYHERRMFIGVRKGQLIATKVPATRGTSGINVLGLPIGQKEGQNLTVTAGENVLYDEKSGEIRATKPGVLSVVQNTIKVSSKLTIPGDINFSTGNIEAHDSVEIGGAVQSGFRVDAQGDLKINGGVRSATVMSQGNVLVKEGVVGKQTVMRVAGDLDVLFVEQAGITAGGTIIIRKNAYFSRIVAGGDIVCEKEGRILGGIIMAGGNLHLGQVGSENAVPALLAAGTDGKQYLKYEELHKELVEKEEEVEHCLQMYGHDSQHPSCLTMSEELEELRGELKRLNLATDKRADTPEELAGKLRSRTISVEGLIYAGTMLRIGNVKTVLEITTAARKFTLSHDLQEIVAHPL